VHDAVAERAVICQVFGAENAQLKQVLTGTDYSLELGIGARVLAYGQTSTVRVYRWS
jgi:hypothetical protein